VIDDPWFYAAAIPAILLIGISKGGFGSGAGIFATPLMALSVPIPQAAAILLPILCVMDVAGLWAYRGRWRREQMGLLLAGGVAGIVIGTLAFRLLDEAWIRIGLGAMSIAFVAQRALWADVSASPPPSRAKGAFWSTAAGFTSMVAHAGGPPLSVYLLPLRLDKAVMVGTTVVFFAVVNFVKLVPYTALGLFDGRNLATSLALAPLAPVGIFLGVALQRRLPERAFYRACYAILLMVGIKLAWDGFARL
jgi:uncharacterized membrane protein YfcA